MKIALTRAWEIASRHFDLLFPGFFLDRIRSVVRHFKGVVVLHAVGLVGSETYSNLLRQHLTTGEFLKFRDGAMSRRHREIVHLAPAR